MRQQIQTTYATSAKEVVRKWYVVDAQGQTLGRIASKIVPYLTGKNKPNYAPYLDNGDFIVVINCEKIHVTGKRMDEKMYWRHSGYPGGIYGQNLRDLLKKHPERAIYFAIRGMLPKGALGHQIIDKLKIYTGNTHPHGAQQPEVLSL